MLRMRKTIEINAIIHYTQSISDEQQKFQVYKEQMNIEINRTETSGIPEGSCRNLFTVGVHYVYTAMEIWMKIIFIIFSYPVLWIADTVKWLFKPVKVVLAFIVGGLQGVFKTLGIGVFGEKVYYAILRENGQYLKIQQKSLEDILTCQLYDYSLRKFMSLPHLDQEMKIAEIQFWSSTGLSYLSKNLALKEIMGLHNSSSKVNKFQTKGDGICYKNIDYSSKQIPNQDVLIFFNRSKEADENFTDIIKILTFIKKNLNEQGYAVFGNCFTNDGEIKVFEELLDAFGLKVQLEEDITRNIHHSRKVLSKIYKNRKIAWLMGRIKQSAGRHLSQCKPLNSNLWDIIGLWNFLQRAAGLKQQFSMYKVYILEHKS